MCLSLPNNIINISRRRSRRNGNDETESKGLLAKEIGKWKKQQQQEQHETMMRQKQDDDQHGPSFSTKSANFTQ